MNRLVAAAHRHPGVSFVAVPCTVLVFAVLAFWPGQHRAPDVSTAGGSGVAVLAQDRAAPAFSAPLLFGPGEVSVHSLRGVVVVNFWASWCAVCRTELPQLAALARRHHDVVFLGVDEQDTRSGGQGLMRRLRPGYRNVSDASGKLLRAFGSIGVPSTFILERGRIRYQALGAVDAADVRRALARVGP